MKTKEKTFKKEFRFKDANDKMAFIELEVTDRNKYLELTICGESDGSHGQCYDSIKPNTKLQKALIKLWKTKHLKKVTAAEIEKIKQLVDDLIEEENERAGDDPVEKVYSQSPDGLMEDIRERGFDEPEKVIALCLEEGCTMNDIDSITHESGNRYSFGGREWLVCTDEEADEEMVEECTNSAWAFNASFLASETGMPIEVFEALQPQCEGANDAIVAIIEKDSDMETFAQAAASADGRGHFLSRYDGHEQEQTVNKVTYYLYRQ